MLITRVQPERLENLVKVLHVLARGYEPLRATSLGESEPFSGFFFANSTGHSQRGLEKVARKCAVWYCPGGGKWQPLQEGTRTTPRTFSFSFMEQKLSPPRGQAMNTIIPRTLVKTLCSWEDWKATRGRGRSLLPFSGKEISVSPEKSLVEKQEF